MGFPTGKTRPGRALVGLSFHYIVLRLAPHLLAGKLKPSDLGLGFEGDADEAGGHDSELGDFASDGARHRDADGDGDDDDDDDDNDDSYVSDSDEPREPGTPRRRSECELLLSEMVLASAPKAGVRSRELSLKLLAEGEHQHRANLHNILARGVMQSYGVLPKGTLLALPLRELILMNADVEARTKLLVWCHRRGIGCATCSQYNHAALMLAPRIRGFNRSATRWWQSPDYWPQVPF